MMKICNLCHTNTPKYREVFNSITGTTTTLCMPCFWCQVRDLLRKTAHLDELSYAGAPHLSIYFDIVAAVVLDYRLDALRRGRLALTLGDCVGADDEWTQTQMIVEEENNA